MLETSLAVEVAADAVRFDLAVTNAGAEPVDLTFRTGQRAEFAVYEAGPAPSPDDPAATADADGEPVWRAGRGRMFTQMLGQETVEPGETRHYEDAWESPDAGSYRVIGEVTASDHNLRAAASFEV